MTATAKKSDSALTEGSTAPDCTLVLTGGTTVRLADYWGKQNVVLYFYPKDDTPGCTTEAKDFRDHAAAFAKAGTTVIGVSKDDMKSHDKFRNKHELPFALASDGGEVCDAFGTWGEKSMYGKKYMGINRATFLIDKKGAIARIWPKVSVPGHAAEVLAAAQKLA